MADSAQNMPVKIFFKFLAKIWRHTFLAHPLEWCYARHARRF